MTEDGGRSLMQLDIAEFKTLAQLMGIEWPEDATKAMIIRYWKLKLLRKDHWLAAVWQ